MTRTQELNRVEIAAYAFALLLIVLGVVLSRVNVDYFENGYAVEDGPVQWLTVVGFAIGGFVCLRRVISLRGRRPAYFLGLTAMLDNRYDDAVYYVDAANRLDEACLSLPGSGQAVAEPVSEGAEPDPDSPTAADLP